MGDLDVLLELQEEWDSLAGRPWAGASRVVGIERGTVVVQAFESGSVSFLRYGEAALLQAIEERFGPGVATSVRVIPPPRGGNR
jgi:predicted nucleic acid-binding Zn ribbon protein